MDPWGRSYEYRSPGEHGAFDLFTLGSAILVYLIAPGVTAMLWWPAIGRGLLGRPMWNGHLFRRMLGFSKCIYLTNIASANRNHLNPLLLKQPALSGSVEAGEASATSQPSAVIPRAKVAADTGAAKRLAGGSVPQLRTRRFPRCFPFSS